MPVKETETFMQNSKNLLKQPEESFAKKMAGSTSTANYEMKIFLSLCVDVDCLLFLIMISLLFNL